MSTFLRDLIEIPERVYKGDFVLRLGEGVSDEHAQETVGQYVVTPELATCFDDALGLIHAALEARQSPPCTRQRPFSTRLRDSAMSSATTGSLRGSTNSPVQRRKGGATSVVGGRTRRTSARRTLPRPIPIISSSCRTSLPRSSPD